MILQALIFYMFAGICVASALMVIVSRNPVHSVLFLILAFFNAAGLFLLLGAEFLAMILVIVYVGAVAVLFLFVVMMLDINFVEMRQGFLTYLPVGGLVGAILLLELLMVVGGWQVSGMAGGLSMAPTPDAAAGTTNTHALGRLLYTDYIYLFQAAGMVLLVAMIGAIVLTLRSREGVRKQVIADQIGRRREATVEVVSVQSGRGIDI
jgi:NADH-quinone oxidoreductase subunit J